MTSRPQIPHRSLLSLLVLVAALSGAATPRATSAEIKTFGDMATFLAETGGAAATGALPDLGLVTTATVGSVTFGVAPGGDNLAIGAAGTLAAPDWYALLPGNDIALGFENLSVATAAPVYALGWEFAQPDVTMPSFGGLAVDSTYEVSLYHGATLVGQAQFTSIPTDVVTFLGVWSSAPFTHAEIVDVTQSPFVDDDEFFGEFFSGTTPLPTVTSFTDRATFLAATGATNASGPLPNLGTATSVKLGSVTYGIAPGGDNMAMGAFGISGLADWCPQIPGNDVALGYENLQLDLDQPVLALGIDFVQPDATIAPWGGTPIDSTYEVALYLGGTFVTQASFSAIAVDQLAFLGVSSPTPFDRVTIIDVTNTPFVDDDEFFGEVYTAPAAGPWTNLGSSQSGVYGDPLLFGTGALTPGSSGSLDLVQANAATPVLLVVALSANPTPALCGTIVPLPVLATLGLMTDPAGEIHIPWASWSSGLSGLGLHFQYLIVDPVAPCGVAMSNALRGDVP
ncbi:MAG: hypothetical protein JNL94_15970 [Planctomycetes bacterium]|nr:hypothetical protein [Planctomycetota bacterium]